MSQTSDVIYKRYDPVQREFYIEHRNGSRKYGTHDELHEYAKSLIDSGLIVQYDDGGAFASLKHPKKQQNRE